MTIAHMRSSYITVVVSMELSVKEVHRHRLTLSFSKIITRRNGDEILIVHCTMLVRLHHILNRKALSIKLKSKRSLA